MWYRSQTLLEDIYTAILLNIPKHFSEESVSTLSETMTDAGESAHINRIKNLTAAIEQITFDAQKKNQDVGGVTYSADTVLIHELLKSHELLYDAESSPAGRWTFSGLREIKQKAGQDNAQYKIPDGRSTFYGSFKYQYQLLDDENGTKLVEHDVIAITPVILDCKVRKPSKDPSRTGIYGQDWWNVYLPMPLLKKLSNDINETGKYQVNEEGIIMDPSQGMASITVNIKKREDSPRITMIGTKERDVKGADDNITTIEELEHTDMDTLYQIMSTGGEDNLLGGVGFFTVGVSVQGDSGSSGPPAGTCVKLCLKMKAFHALHMIESGVRRINYQSASSGLKY